MEIQFKKRMGKTIGEGTVTVPVEFNSLLDQSGLCPLGGRSIDVDFSLPDGTKLPGSLYQSENNSTCYYQFRLRCRDDKSLFRKKMARFSQIQLSFDFSAMDLLINS